MNTPLQNAFAARKKSKIRSVPSRSGLLAFVAVLLVPLAASAQKASTMESIGRTMLDGTEEKLDAAKGCDLPVFPYRTIVLAVSPRGAEENILAGDDIVAINGVDVSDGDEMKDVLVTLPENGEVQLTVLREGKTVVTNVACQSAAEGAARTRAFFAAMAAGDARECVRQLQALRTWSGKFYLTENFATHCLQQAYPDEYAKQFATILYENTKLTIEQTRHAPDLFEGQRAKIIGGIDTLKAWGAYEYAEEVKADYWSAQKLLYGDRSATTKAKTAEEPP